MSNTIEERVKKIIVDMLGVKPEDVVPEASFVDDLGADSLDTVELVMALEEEFGTDIPDEDAEKINEDRLASWKRYYDGLSDLEAAGKISLPVIPDECVHNAHMFYIKTKDMEERSALIQALDEKDIISVFHYIPLHSSEAGLRFGEFRGEDEYTTKESERLLRLPMYYGLTEEDTDRVIDAVHSFYGI